MKKYWLFLVVSLFSFTVHAQDAPSLDDMHAKITNCFGDGAGDFFAKYTNDNKNPLTKPVSSFILVDEGVIKQARTIINLGTHIPSIGNKDEDGNSTTFDSVAGKYLTDYKKLLKISSLNNQHEDQITIGLVTFMGLFYRSLDTPDEKFEGSTGDQFLNQLLITMLKPNSVNWNDWTKTLHMQSQEVATNK